MMFVIAVCCLFWMPGMIASHESGENYFTIYLNEAKIGATDSIDKIDEVMAQARRIIAGDSTELLYAKMDLEVEGKEVIFGKIDSQRALLNRVAGVLVENSVQTLQRAYTVKVNEYSVNLASSEEVKQLLDAALDKYDTKNEYSVNLTLDPTRELHVLTAQVEKIEVQEAEEKEVFWESGVEKYIEDIFVSMEPEVERSFDDYSYGLQDMNFAEKIEIVETFLMPEEISSLEKAIEDVTKDKEVNEITFLDVIESEERSIEDEIDLKMKIKKLYQKIGDVLQDRERLIIELRFGLNGKETKTQNQIAKQLGISRSYVSRIETKAINKLSKEFR